MIAKLKTLMLCAALAVPSAWAADTAAGNSGKREPNELQA